MNGSPFFKCRYDGVSFGLANSWVWIPSNATIRSKVKILVERITGEYCEKRVLFTKFAGFLLLLLSIFQIV